MKWLLRLLPLLSELIRKDCNRFFFHDRQAIVAEMQALVCSVRNLLTSCSHMCSRKFTFGFQYYSELWLCYPTLFFFGWEFTRYQPKACQDSARQIRVLEYVGNKKSAVNMMRPVSLLALQGNKFYLVVSKVILNIIDNLLKVKCVFCGTCNTQ